MKHSLSKYLEDILLSIGDINNHSKNINSVKELEGNLLVYDAVCRRFAVIGEALYQANKIKPDLIITDKKRIISLRHIIVHEYDTVRAVDLWQIMQNKLSILKLEVEELLKDLE